MVFLFDTSATDSKKVCPSAHVLFSLSVADVKVSPK